MTNLTIEETAYLKTLLHSDIESLRDMLETCDTDELVQYQNDARLNRTIFSKLLT